MVFFYLAITGWIFYISLCENPINQSINIRSKVSVNFADVSGFNTTCQAPRKRRRFRRLVQFSLHKRLDPVYTTQPPYTYFGTAVLGYVALEVIMFRLG